MLKQHLALKLLLRTQNYSYVYQSSICTQTIIRILLSSSLKIDNTGENLCLTSSQISWLSLFFSVRIKDACSRPLLEVDMFIHHSLDYQYCSGLHRVVGGLWWHSIAQRACPPVCVVFTMVIIYKYFQICALVHTKYCKLRVDHL